jgi:hypothetical protein
MKTVENEIEKYIDNFKKYLHDYPDERFSLLGNKNNNTLYEKIFYSKIKELCIENYKNNGVITPNIKQLEDLRNELKKLKIKGFYYIDNRETFSITHKINNI